MTAFPNINFKKASFLEFRIRRRARKRGNSRFRASGQKKRRPRIIERPRRKLGSRARIRNGARKRQSAFLEEDVAGGHPVIYDSNSAGPQHDKPTLGTRAISETEDYDIVRRRDFIAR